jgi:uncharacterized protein
MKRFQTKFRVARLLLRFAGVLSTIGCLLIAACSLPLPQAQNDPTKFYVLSATDAAPPPAAIAVAPAIRLRPIELATYLQSRPMIVRRGENEIEFRDFSRWGEPLEQGIARVLRDELLAHHAANTVQTGAVRPSDLHEVPFELSVRVLACEGGADGAVVFHATWQIASPADNGKIVAHGDYRPTDLRWTPRHEATLAGSLSKAVAGLAADIAAGLAK